MNQPYISDSIFYIGANDKDLDLFESQYAVPNGVSYNSYVIMDEKTLVMDTVDARASEQWIANLEQVLAGEPLDYLVVSHMEPDHGANVKRLIEMHPEVQVVGNAKTFSMIEQFFQMDLGDRRIVVKEGETLNIGAHTLQFFMAPMVHWPEVMVTYEQKEKILFSADAFGKFGVLDIEEDWTEEAARYYLNIVGKYGMQVQTLLKKVEGLDLQRICPLHGPVLSENLEYYLEKYQTWSTYMPEQSGVLLVHASIHGNTASATVQMAGLLQAQGVTTELLDLTRCDMSVAVRKAFYYDRMLVAGATYDGGVFPPMEEFLLHLKSKNYQRRTVGILENGSWAPQAGKVMGQMLEAMKVVRVLEPMVTVKSVVNPDSLEVMKQLARQLSEA